MKPGSSLPSLILLTLSIFFVREASGAKKLRVVTTIETFADLARQVGGDRIEVQPLSHGYQDPHFVEPKPSLMITLNRADLLIHVGLELEIGWLPPLVVGSRNERIQVGSPGNLDASTGIDLLDVPAVKVDRSLGDIHPQGNPHYWIPPANALVVAQEITERLKAIDPAGASSYDHNFTAFAEKLRTARASWETKAVSLRGKKIVTYHKSWSYLSRWLGLVEVGYVEPKPGIPAPPSYVAQLIGLIRREGVKLLIMESFYPRNTVDLIAQKSGARSVVLESDVGADASVRDYFSLVDHVIQRLVEAGQ